MALQVLKNLFGGTHKIASTEIAVKDGRGTAVTLDTLPHGFQFKTTEQWTGQYWLDRKKIYTLSFAIPKFNNTKINVNFGVKNIEQLVDVKGAFLRDGYDYFFSIDNMYMSEYRIYKSSGMLEIATNNAYVTLSGYITLFYTCTNK